jgi:hypothetical protein
MSRHITKQKKIKMKGFSGQDRERISDMFNELTGAKIMKKKIALKKIVDILEQINELYKLFKLFKQIKNMENTIESGYNDVILDIDKFLESIKTIYKDFDKDKYLLEFNLSNEFNEEQLNEIYKNYTENTTFKNIIISTGNLNSQSEVLNDEQKIEIGVTDKFIISSVGLELKPLNFINLELKQLWFNLTKDNNIAGKKFFLSFIKKFYSHGYKIYNIFTRPSVDIDECSELLINAILKLRRAIPNCDEAFNTIESSIGLFKSNFNNYYCNFVKTKDVSIILSDYISDMCCNYKNKTPLPILTRQLEKIGNYIISKLPKERDERVNNLINMLKHNINLMKKENPEENEDPNNSISDEKKNIENNQENLYTNLLEKKLETINEEKENDDLDLNKPSSSISEE